MTHKQIYIIQINIVLEMPNKLEIDECYKIMQKNNYTLKSEFINGNNPISYECNYCNAVTVSTLSTIKKRNIIKYCLNCEHQTKLKNTTVKEIHDEKFEMKEGCKEMKKILEANGYVLVSSPREYENVKTKMLIKIKDHPDSTSYPKTLRALRAGRFGPIGGKLKRIPAERTPDAETEVNQIMETDDNSKTHTQLHEETENHDDLYKTEIMNEMCTNSHNETKNDNNLSTHEILESEHKNNKLTNLRQIEKKCSCKGVCEHYNLSKILDLVPQYHPTKNTKPMNKIAPKSGKKVWWVCDGNGNNGCGVKGCHEWQATPSNRVVNGQNCPFCSESNSKPCQHNNFYIRNKEFCDEYYDKSLNNNLDLTKLCANSHKMKIKFKCMRSKCGNSCIHIWDATPLNITNGQGCPYCSNNQHCKHKSLAYLRPDIAKEWNYTRNKKKPQDYAVSSNELVWWNCEEEHEWQATIDNRTLNNSRCGTCRYEPQGEAAIAQMLDKENIKYERQKRFSDCKYKNTLSFDFYIPAYDILIEFDGIQHFNMKSSYVKSDLKVFRNSVSRDIIKTIYAKEHKIDLIRIGYDVLFDIQTMTFDEIIHKMIYNNLYGYLSEKDNINRVYKLHSQVNSDNVTEIIQSIVNIGSEIHKN